MAEVLREYEAKIDAITLIPSDGGCFEVTVDGTLVYSKLATGRHVESGETAKCVGEHL
jgi:selenoprotein W-related protein